MSDLSAFEQAPRLDSASLNSQISDLNPFRVFFNAGDVRAMLRSADCVGVVFFLVRGADANPDSLIATGVDANKKPLTSFFQSQGTEPSKVFTREEADAMIKKASLNAFFSKLDLSDELSEVGCIGLRFTPAKITQKDELTLSLAVKESIDSADVFQSMSMIGVDINMKDMEEHSGYAVSMIPCPPKCPPFDEEIVA